MAATCSFVQNLKSHGDADVQASIDYGRKLKVYPLSAGRQSAGDRLHRRKDILFDSTIKWDASFFDNLNRIVQEEPWITRDRVMIDQLKSLGIEKGKPFMPDQHVKSLLTVGIKEARRFWRRNTMPGSPFFTDKSRWTFPAYPDLIKAAQFNFDEPDAYPVDHRGVAYSYAYIGTSGWAQAILFDLDPRQGRE